VIKTGIDLVEIDRIRKSVLNKRFVQRVFAECEIEYFNTLSDPIPSIAANFSAKEAFGKALGTGISGFLLKEVAILRDDKGAPYFVFFKKALELVENSNLSFSISLTHTKTTAAAVVLAY